MKSRWVILLTAAFCSSVCTATLLQAQVADQQASGEGTTLGPPTTEPSSPLGAIVLTIDGVDFDMQAFGVLGTVRNVIEVADGDASGLETDNITGRGDSYLVGPVRQTWTFATDVRYYAWRGDAAQTERDIPNLKVQIAGLAQIARRRQEAFIILAHSWGSVLAYRAVSELWAEGVLERDSIRKIVTIGSPIEAQNPAWRTAAINYMNWSGTNGILEPTESWTNYWINTDDFSGRISEHSDNVELPYSSDNPHSAYYANSTLWMRITSDVAADLAAYQARSSTSATDSSTTVSSTTAPASVECSESVVQRGLSGNEVVIVLEGTAGFTRRDAIMALVRSEQLRVPLCANEARDILQGTVGAARVAAISLLAASIVGDLTGPEATMIFGSSEELSEFSRRDAISALKKAGRLKARYSGDELVGILAGTTGAARTASISVLSSSP